MDSKEYWNMVANEKKFSTPFQMDLYKKYVSNDKRILDIGCGYGRILKELYDNGYTNLLGIDFSSEMIKLANSLYPYINFNITNGDKLNYEDNSIDSIILFAVLTCIYDNNSQLNLINEIYRVLKKDGIIYINDFRMCESHSQSYRSTSPRLAEGVQYYEVLVVP